MKLTVQDKDFLNVHVEEAELEIEVPVNVHASLFLTYDNLKHLDLSLCLQRGSQLKLLLQNKGETQVQCQLNADVFGDASLKLGFLEVEQGNSEITCSIRLKEPYAKADLISATLAHSVKHYHVDIIHECGDSEGIMNHYAVIKDDASYRMKASGIIQKGARQSASHQKTRVLTMTKKHHCKVDPILLIDEDEVKASHAMTLGQMDENQLYYLMSRGLSRQEALGLLSIGYLMPITQFFDDEKLNAAMKEEMEKKVGLHV